MKTGTLSSLMVKVRAENGPVFYGPALPGSARHLAGPARIQFFFIRARPVQELHLVLAKL